MPVSFEFTYTPIPLFDFGPLTLSLHGLLAAIAFVAGSSLAVRRAGRRGFDREAYISMFNWALVGAILGARYFTIGPQIANGDSFLQIISPLGNFSILGGMLGGILGGAWQGKRLRQPFWALTDTVSYGLAVGTIVGRIGDLAIVEHLGAATSSVFGYVVKSGYDLAPQHTALECGVPGTVLKDVTCGTYHPTWLYDMFGALVLLGFLYWLGKVWKGRHYGQLFSVWVMWYGAQRFVIDFARHVPVEQGADAAASADALLGSLTWSQWSGVGMVLVGFFLMFYLGRKNPVVSPENDEVLSSAAGRPLQEASSVE